MGQTPSSSADSPLITVRDSPLYRKHFTLLERGVPLLAVQERIASQGPSME